jgi:uncharacterized membrane protein
MPSKDPSERIPALTYRLFLVGTLIWSAAIAAAPIVFLMTDPGSSSGSLLYSFFGSVCHQVSARSFHIGGEPFAVCERCTSIYFAFTAGLLVYPRVSLRLRPAVILLWALAPMVTDVLLSALGVHSSTLFTRVVSGSIFGFLIPACIIPAAQQAAMEIFAPGHSPSTTHEGHSHA